MGATPPPLAAAERSNSTIQSAPNPPLSPLELLPQVEARAVALEFPSAQTGIEAVEADNEARALRATEGEQFVPNDCPLADGSENAHIWLLTGPNMSGKSTFLRQNALIALLAQSGSYVPADKADLVLVSSCSAASAPRTIWRGADRHSWSRWSRRRRS